MMKHALNILIFLFTTTVFAQYPDTIYSKEETRKMAQEITSAYDAQLGLTGRQWPIFENKIKDYLELSQKVKDTYEGRTDGCLNRIGHKRILRHARYFN